jgi:hypothetical protein
VLQAWWEWVTELSRAFAMKFTARNEWEVKTKEEGLGRAMAGAVDSQM